MKNKEPNYTGNLILGVLIAVGIVCALLGSFDTCTGKHSGNDATNLIGGLFVLCVIFYFAYRNS